MATDMVTSADRVQKFFDDLETQKAILSTCTQLFTNLSNHFTSLQDSLSEKSKTLESKLQALESHSQQTLQSLDQREKSIPERESADADRVKEQKEAALAEFEKSAPSNADLSEALKSFSRRMDSSGLLKFVISRRKESVSLRAEISPAIEEAVDPPRLVLDALEEFIENKSAKVGVTDKRWACGMLVQGLFPEANAAEKAPPEFSRSVVERAGKIVESWKQQVDADGGNVASLGPAEAVMLLQMVLGFGLRAKFDEGFLKKLILEFSSRRDMAKLAAAFRFGEKMRDIIDELVKTGKEIEAVYFASESGLTEQFPPVSLLKSYLRNSRNNAATILKNGNTEESNNVELNSIKAIIKCVEDHKLEPKFSLESLRKRAAQLEKAKAERKKSSAAAGKTPNKRPHGGGFSGGRGSGPPSFRPPKAAKFSNAYPTFSRRNPVPAPPVYNYGGQSFYESPAATPYAAAYSGPHSQSPAAPIPQPHYSHPALPAHAADGIGIPGVRSSGSYGGQPSYSAYDYAAAAPSYQPPPYTQ